MATARPETEQLLEQATRSHREGRLPAARSLYSALALFRHGLLELQAGDAQAAYPLIKQAVAEAPEKARYHLGLGAVAEQLDQWPDAIAAYQAAIALQAGDADSYNALGNCLRRCGLIELAESAYCEALRLQPERADPAPILAECRRRNKHYAVGLQDARAIRMHPCQGGDFGSAMYRRSIATTARP